MAMKLFYSHASPYARQCRIALDLCGLLPHSELVLTNPLEDEAHRQINPLGKVPALIDGEKVLFDSPLICEYINHIGLRSQSSSRDIFCKDSANYFAMRLEHAAANGILDAAVATVMEGRRQTEKSDYWLGRWQEAIQSCVSTRNSQSLDRLCASDTPTIAGIAMACALGYLDFRLPQFSWRDWNPSLADWFEKASATSWMQDSTPQ